MSQIYFNEHDETERHIKTFCDKRDYDNRCLAVDALGKCYEVVVSTNKHNKTFYAENFDAVLSFMKKDAKSLISKGYFITVKESAVSINDINNNKLNWLK